MMKLIAVLASILFMLNSASPVRCEVYCDYPNFDPGLRDWHTVDLADELDVGDLLPQLNNDINLYVEQSLWDNYQAPGQIVDDDHLEQFIRGIWRSHEDNDIRTIWDYFAANSPSVGPDLPPQYGDFGTNDYNFEYPDLSWLGHRNLKEVEIYLVGGMDIGGSAGGNQITIDIAGHFDEVEEVPDWWYIHEWAGSVFCHEFQHTVKSCFDQWEDLEEAFAEAATSVAGAAKINVGFPHGDNTWPRYDLVFNNGIPRGRSSDDPYYAWQSPQTDNVRNKYTGYWLWTTYIYEQFPGQSSADITDDLLYQVLRVTDGEGEPIENMHAFYEAAANYSAPDWGYENPDPDLYREIFRSWTLANVLDGTDFNTRHEYGIQDIRIRYDEDSGTGWLRDNEDIYCNDPPANHWCGDWEPPVIWLDEGLNEPFVREGESDCSWDPIVGIELYAADYVKFVANGSFPPNTLLSMAFNVHDEDQAWDSNNILIQAHVVGYGSDENDIVVVQDVDVTQSPFPSYDGIVYHSVDDFGSVVNSLHTVVSAMENAVGISGRYPMRSYSITASVVPKVVENISGTLSSDTRWYHGQTINVTGHLYVDPEVTLTIEPGVTVEVSPGWEIEIGVAGVLDARGNSVHGILFTSDSSSPAPGDWVGIHTIGSNGVLLTEHCTVEYAEQGMAVATTQAHVFTNNVYRQCSENALWLQGCSITGESQIGGNLFDGNSYGVYMDNATVNSFIGNSFTDNITGMYMEEGAVLNSDGFRDLYFGDNQYGLYMVKPQGTTTHLKNSTFERHSDCAIYYNRQNGSGDLSVHDLTIVEGTGNMSAGIRAQGQSTEPVVRHCEISEFDDGFFGGIGISCRMAATVDAGTKSDHGDNLFQDNDFDIEYRSSLSPPRTLYALGNCWDGPGGEPDLWGQVEYILWSEDCTGWGGFGVPPRPEEPIMAGLANVYPNPLEDGVRIEYGIPEAAIPTEAGIRVALRIYDLSGRLVKELVQGDSSPGIYSTNWDGRDDSGQAVSAGVYVCRLETEMLVDSKRIVLTR